MGFSREYDGIYDLLVGGFKYLLNLMFSSIQKGWLVEMTCIVFFFRRYLAYFFHWEICCDWGIWIFSWGAYVFLGGVPEANPSARDMRGNNEIMCRTSIEGWWFKGMGTICEYYKSLCLWHKWGYVTIVPICIHNITYIFIHIWYVTYIYIYIRYCYVLPS